MAFAELNITSNFTFLTGASHPEEYVDRAALLGLKALAIADENSVAGIVRAHTRVREIARQVKERESSDLIGPPVPVGLWAKKPQVLESYPGGSERRKNGTLAPEEIEDFLDGPKAAFETRVHPSLPLDASAAILNVPRLIPAARIVLDTGFTVTTIPKDRQGWANLCRLISRGRLRAEKGSCHLRTDDLVEFGANLALLIHPPNPRTAKRGASGWRQEATRLTRHFGPDCHLLIAPRYDGQDPERFDRLACLADDLKLPTVASASPLMHHGSRRKLADVLTAVRTSRKVDELGRAALANAEQRLRSETDLCRLLGPHAGAVTRAAELAGSLAFSLDELRYEYPSEVTNGETAPQRLSRLAHEGLKWRYPAGASDHVKTLLAHELTLISKLEYEPYFLTVRDIVAFARSRGILCQGRGSAANSVVCYCLGVTSVSPEIGTMVFERFVSEARDEPPDIDVDFEHERREEVIQHIYERYGRHRAGPLRHRRPLPRQTRDPRGGPRDGPDRRHDLRALLATLGLLRDLAAWPTSNCRKSASTRTDRRLATDAWSWSSRSKASRATCPSTSAASSSPKGGSTNWCPSRTLRWRTAPSSVGTRTTSTAWASSRSTCSRSACCRASARPSA